MRKLTKEQNQRIKAARKEFLAARHKYKTTVSKIRGEGRSERKKAKARGLPAGNDVSVFWVLGLWRHVCQKLRTLLKEE